MTKNNWIYFFIVLACLAGFFISTTLIKNKLFNKEIVYHSGAASEAFLAWELTDGSMPDEWLWPKGSYVKDGLIYTKMKVDNDTFKTRLRLHGRSQINYWILITKDKAGNNTEIWESGGDDKQYLSASFGDSMINPGYFILLAGMLPLLLHYFKNRKNPLVEKTKSVNIPEYIPQFDSIRAIAVLLVIVHHWLGEIKILNILPNGPLGVNLFFVLSGFLITGILLKAKKQITLQGLKRSTALRNFYVRRTLRIFPIYYLLLILLWILEDASIRKDAVYYFTYTSNYLFFAREFFSARLAHLWSLAVEEQFYVFWPWLIIFANKHILPYIFPLFIVIGISSNYIFTSHGWWVQIFTLACFDAFAIGGFLSYLLIYRSDMLEKVQPVFKWVFLIILLLFICDAAGFVFLPRRTTHSLIAASIIYYCLFMRNNKIINFFLESKGLMHLGKISYGVYLYHLFIPELWSVINKVFSGWGIDLFFNQKMPAAFRTPWIFLQEFAFLLLMSIVSWKFIEQPINRLKIYFENQKELRNKTTLEKEASK